MTDHAGDSAEAQHAVELRQTSDAFIARLERLHELETRKRELPVGQPEFVRLAREIEDLSRALLYVGSRQADLAEEVHADVKRGDAVVDQPIIEIPPRRDAPTVLSEWRDAERRLAAAHTGSSEEQEARTEIERLRAEYRAITMQVSGDRPI